jgi:hypothetical protein
MQTIPTHGLLVSFEGDVCDHEKYEFRKNIVEHECELVEKYLQKEKYDFPTECIAIDSKSDKKLTMSASEGEIQLGIYLESENCIKQVCTEEDLMVFQPASLKKLSIRLISALNKGRSLGESYIGYPRVQTAWDDLFAEQEYNLAESLRYISEKYDCEEDELSVQEVEGYPSIVSVDRGIVFAVLDGRRMVQDEPVEGAFFHPIDLEQVKQVVCQTYPDADPELIHMGLLRVVTYEGEIIGIFDKNTGELAFTGEDAPEISAQQAGGNADDGLNGKR